MNIIGEENGAQTGCMSGPQSKSCYAVELKLKWADSQGHALSNYAKLLLVMDALWVEDWLT